MSFRHLILPTPFAPHTALLDLRPMPVGALRNAAAERLYTDAALLGAAYKRPIGAFNAVQTQAFNCLYETDDNTLVCAPAGSGTILCAEFAMLRLWNRSPSACAVFVAPVPTSCDRVFEWWRRRFGTAPGGLGKTVVRLTGDDLVDVKLLSSAQLVVADPQQWDKVSRRWKQRKAVREVGLFVVGDLHLIGGQYGPTLEVVVSRMRYVAAQVRAHNHVSLFPPLCEVATILVSPSHFFFFLSSFFLFFFLFSFLFCSLFFSRSSRSSAPARARRTTSCASWRSPRRSRTPTTSRTGSECPRRSTMTPT